MSECTRCIKGRYADLGGATSCKACPDKAVTTDVGTSSFAGCLCTPATRFTMQAGECVGCPAGATCDASGKVEATPGFWMAAKDKLGSLAATVTVPLPYATFGTGPGVSNFTRAVQAAIAEVAGTSEGSVRVERLTAVQGGAGIQVAFTVQVPVTMKASQVDARLKAFNHCRSPTLNLPSLSLQDSTRRLLSLAAALTAQLAAAGLNITVASASGYSVSAIVEPIPASSLESYACPYPKAPLPTLPLPPPHPQPPSL